MEPTPLGPERIEAFFLDPPPKDIDGSIDLHSPMISILHRHLSTLPLPPSGCEAGRGGLGSRSLRWIGSISSAEISVECAATLGPEG